ncbi:MAG: M23 family metallopeptidase, partial [Rhodospirillales bacterium]
MSRDLSFIRKFLATALLSISPATLSGAADFPELSLPIDCKLGEDCWIINYFDHAPENRILDYTGGTNLYDEHQGIDIAIPSIRAMIQGVDVLAVADGVVLAIRDHIPDVGSVDRDGRRIDFPKCGNAVLLDHGNELRTQYCHMRRGSISVQVGDKVSRGHRIGLVGLSGFTNFPHIHLAVSLGEDKIDPFVGPGWKPDSGATPQP